MVRNKITRTLSLLVVSSTLQFSTGGAAFVSSSQQYSIEDTQQTVSVVPAPSIGKPFVRGTNISLTQFGYRTGEYFFSGEARSYSTNSPLGEEGKWLVYPTACANYNTRMLVYRPANPEDFNGTVVVEWLNVTGGLDTAVDWVMLHTEILRKGYAWVGVSAQYVGVELGGETPLPPVLGFTVPLKLINPLRYWRLSHPGDSFSYDIFAGAVKAVRGQRVGADPMAGLRVDAVIAAGESQSAQRLITFMNSFGKQFDLIDGYFIHSRLGYTPEFDGAAAPLSQAPQEVLTTANIVNIRDDLQKPVLNLQTETDVLRLESHFSRQPDSEYFRLWELAGTSHIDSYAIDTGARDTGTISSALLSSTRMPIPFTLCDKPINSAPQHHFVAKAALRALDQWIATGEAPAHSPRLTLNANGDSYLYDDFGNVRGGIRSPYMDVPTALLLGSNPNSKEDSNICFLLGETELFDETTIRQLYPSMSYYVDAVSRSAYDMQAKGFLLPEDVQIIIEAARASNLPL